MTKKDLKTLRRKLPKVNRYEEINKVLLEEIGKKYSAGTIKQVLYGHRSNDSIVLAAINVAHEHQLKLTSAIESIK